MNDGVVGDKLDRLRAFGEKSDHWRAVERAAFIPSTCMERLVLQVMGAWENLLGEINFSRFTEHAAATELIDPSPLRLSVSLPSSRTCAGLTTSGQTSLVTPAMSASGSLTCCTSTRSAVKRRTKP